MNVVCLTARASDWRGLIGVQREVQGSDVGVGLHSSVSEIVGRVFYSANFTEWLRVWWDVDGVILALWWSILSSGAGGGGNFN